MNHPKAKINYHIHTNFSDGTGKIEDYIRYAIKNNLKEIGFSDHLAFSNLPYVRSWSMKLEKLKDYVDCIMAARKNSRIKIKLGIEMDYLPHKISKIKSIIESNKFDYVIGSVHLVDSFLVDSEDFIFKWKKMKEEEIYDIYARYFHLLQLAAKSKLFDIIGHADVVKKFGFRPKRSITGLLEETADVFAQSDVVVEVNSSGLRKPCREIYPGRKFLKLCYHNQVKVTLGNDAHKPEEVALNDSLELIKEIGYKEIVTFSHRKRQPIKI